MKHLRIALVATLIAAPAAAQTLQYGALEQLFGEPVTASATGEPLRASEAPVDMEIVTQEDIRRSGAVDIPGALRFVTGIDERVYGANHSEIGVRGYNQPFNPRLLVLLNGRQVYLDDYGEVDWKSIPVQLSEIRQIEVVKGPNSALYGFNAAYGVINIITYDPLEDHLGVANLTLGMPNEIDGSLVKILRLGDDAGLRISLGGQNVRALAGTNSYMQGLPVVGDRNGTAAVSGKVRLSPRTELSLEVSATDSRGAYNEGYSYSNVFIRTNSVRVGLSSESDLGLMTLDAYRNEERYSDLPNYGAEHGRVYVLQGSEDLILDPDNSLRVHGEYRSDQLTQPGGGISYDIYAGSLMWNWRITDRLSFVNSGRVDYLTMHFDGKTAPRSGLTNADYANRTITGFSFNSGLVYRATDRDSIRLFAGRGLQIPSLYDLAIQDLFPNYPYGPYAVVGNPHLEPTAVLNVGLDWDRDLPEIASKLSVGVFAQRSDDLYIEPSSAPGIPIPTPPYYYYYQATQTGYGLAAGTEITLKGGLKSGLRWRASYSFTTTPDHSGIDYGKYYSYVDFGYSTPRHVVTLGIGDSWGPWDADLQARWQSEYRDFVAPDQEHLFRYDIGAYATVDARVAYRLDDTSSIALSAQQLNAASQRETGGPNVQRRVLLSLTAGF